MKIESVYFGEVDVKDEQLIYIKNGIPGFQEETHFALFDVDGNPAFKIMQSTKTTELAFVLTDPFLINPNYEFKLDDATIEQLSVENSEDLTVWAIVTVKDPFVQSTMNLRAPVVINQTNNQAKQVSLVGTDYHTKHPIKGGEHHARVNT